MPGLSEVQVDALPPERFQAVLDDERWQILAAANARAEAVFAGRRVINVNSTATGGGVAEMLQSLVAYARGAGVDTRWYVIEGTPEFFVLTKRLHHKLHGSDGDGGPLGPAEHALYDATTAANAAELTRDVSPGDVVLLHDPQTAGLAAALRDRGAHVLWRSHIGIDVPNDAVEAAWAFLLPYVEHAEAFIFTRRAYAPPELAHRDVTIIPPSIDVFSQKNDELAPATVDAILKTAGVLAGTPSAEPRYVHRDGRTDVVHRRASMTQDEPILDTDPLVTQVSRWDPLKDPLGVMYGFAEYVAARVPAARLLLAGPSPVGVTDDPEGGVVLEQVVAARAGLAPAARRRVHIASLPMEDHGENAAMVNAIQRHATVVVQKSLAEGFGLTVAEAMWKRRPVVASRVGGIQDQILEGSGILLDDPADLAAYGDAVASLLEDPDGARRIGEAAHERVRAEFLGSRHLVQYLELFARLIAERA
jgi:trehalose synthase